MSSNCGIMQGSTVTWIKSLFQAIILASK